MIKRTNLQPDPMTDYYLESIDGTVYFGRWLVGKSYEGWYLKPRSGTPITERCVKSQNELGIISFSETEPGSPVKRYIPKILLDEAFRGKSEIAHLYFSAPL